MKLTAAGTVGAYHHSLFIFEVWASKNQMRGKDTLFSHAPLHASMKEISKYLWSMRSLVILFFLFAPALAFAQISEQDLRVLARIKSDLALSNEQNLSLDSLYAKKQTEIDALDKQIRELQQSAEDGATLSTKVSVLQQKKKDIKNMREIELELILTAAQRLVYQEKIKPVKPQVLHYGMNHDRASCNVCK